MRSGEHTPAGVALSRRARFSARLLRYGPLTLYFLAVTLAYTWFSHSRMWNKLYGDEWRYLWYAQNLTKGYFSPPEYVFLWSGPGYPLFLAPWVALDAPVGLMRGVNGVLLGAAHVMFFCFVRRFARPMTAAAFTVLFGLYLPFVNFSHFLYTESLTVLLVVGLLNFLSSYIRGGNAWALLASGVSFGWLVLVKIGFWPMLFGGGVLSLVGYATRRHVAFKRMAFAMSIGILCCVPYLVHTYRATGRFFYWGAGSGHVLYWIANPTEGSTGEHLNPNHIRGIPAMRRDHWALYERLGRFDGKFEKGYVGLERVARSLYHLSSPETDDELRQRGLRNIAAHPQAYAKNVAYNASRLVVDRPHIARKFTAESMRMAICNPIVLLGVIVALPRLLRGKVGDPHMALFAGWMLSLYLGMTVLLAAVSRYFIAAAPLGLALIALAYAAPLDRWFAKRFPSASTIAATRHRALAVALCIGFVLVGAAWLVFLRGLDW